MPKLVNPSPARFAEYALAAAERHDADGEADDSGAHDQLAAVLANLAAPVGELGDAVAQRLDRVAELLTLALDVGADLRRGAADRRGAAGDRLAGAAAIDLRLVAHLGDGSLTGSGVVPDSSVWRMRLPSSIAISGTGGAPALTAR